MRRVLSSLHEVAHYWANKVQSEGRASNFYFRDDKIFSYGGHFCIARHLPDGVVALTTRTYSPSTGRHQSLVRGAISHLKRVYCYDPTESARFNKDRAQKAIEIELADSGKPRIRQTTRDAHKARALSLAEEFNEYLAALPEDERNVDPIDTSNFESLREHLVVQKLAEIKAEKEREERRKQAEAENLERWRNGEDVRMHFNASDIILRCKVRDGHEVIETSRGAMIPQKSARRLWPIVQRVRKEGKEFRPVEGVKVGNYTLSKISPEGDITVGCHHILYSELERISKQIGL